MATSPRRSSGKASKTTKPARGASRPSEAKPTDPPAKPPKQPTAKPAAPRKRAAPAKGRGAAASKNAKRAGESATRRPHKPETPGSTPGPATNPEASATVAQLLAADGAQDPETGLTPRLRAFADEYMRDLNGTAAYLRIHPGAKVTTAATESWRILRNPKVRAYIAATRERLELAADFSKADLLRELVSIVRADPREITQMRQISCDHCWPHDEEDEAPKGKTKKDLLAPRKGLPMWQEPNPDCEHCQGEGIPKPWFADVRKLSTGAARLFQSVHVTKDGMRINLRDQDSALDKLAKILGAYELDNDQKGQAAADVLRAFFGGLHGSGANLPNAPPEQRAPAQQAPAALAQQPGAAPPLPGNPLVRG
jgi:phage terminase small subunit